MSPQTLIPSGVLLHRQLLDELVLISQDTKLTLEERTIVSAQKAIDYSDRVCALIPENGFEDPADEIRFFKQVKPLFTAEREYYQRRYQAGIFENISPAYYQREILRMEKLLAENKDFVDYIRGRHCHNDDRWFRQGMAPEPTSLCMLPWETDPRTTSARDSWVAGMLAVERFRDWLKTLLFSS